MTEIKQCLRLLKFLKPYKARLILAYVCTFIAQPAKSLQPLVILYIIDDLLISDVPRFSEYLGNTDHLKLKLFAISIGIMAVLFIIYTALNSVQDYILNTIGHQLVFDLRNKTYQHLQDLSMSFFTDMRSGDLSTRIITDVNNLQNFIIKGLNSVFGSLIQTFWIVGIMVFISWKLVLILFPPLVILLFIMRHYNKHLRYVHRNINQELGKLAAIVHDNLSGMQTIKTTAMDEYEAERFSETNQQLLNHNKKSVILENVYYSNLINCLSFAGFLFVISTCGYMVIIGKLTVGAMIALQKYFADIVAPVTGLSKINSLLQKGSTAFERVFEIIDRKIDIEDKADAVEMKNPKGHIIFDDVTFSYTPEQTLLKNFNLEINPGEQIGITGPSGSGKSTLFNLLFRLFDVSEGKIMIDGRDIRDYQQLSLRQHMSVVTQEPFLFNDTIWNNIVYGKFDASEDDVTEAAKAANAHDFIMELRDAYDTNCAERGIRLSGGQRQRIVIARAFLKNPEILLLDECTASVEPESEAIIQETLDKLMRNRTTIIISHRLSMVRHADKILVLDKGVITEKGSYQELMELNGWFARMEMLQGKTGIERDSDSNKI